MRLLYLDLNNSGISGDMFLASLLGLVPEEANKILEGLLELKNYLPGVSKLTVGLIKIPRSGIQLNQLKLEIKETKNHRSAKTLKDSMNKYLNEKNFTQLAKNYANQVLDKLIHAEADVHGKLIENIHLHELSSVDTLVDILGVTTALDQINGFEEDFKVFCSKLPLGGGRVKTAHGMLAVPAPATLKIIENSNLITYGGPIDSELVTPTGAALLTSLNPKFHQHLPELTIQKSSSSTGQKEFEDFLNEMRIYYGEYKGLETSEKINWMENYTQKVSVIETNVDDVSGEILGNFINNLRNENVLDIQIIPSITKKNRPSHIIQILCHPEYTIKLIEKTIHELGTLGVRFNTINRVCIERIMEKRPIEIEGKSFDVNFKISYISSEKGKKIINIKPEFEDIKKISEDLGVTIKRVEFGAQAHLEQLHHKYSQKKKQI
ncbi:MAG: nickel pincer cofactor biosynthesis protein LarC [Promethearchaeota archaeon]|jgi:uncharacterized protein (TIGR00299 family) protein